MTEIPGMVERIGRAIAGLRRGDYENDFALFDAEACAILVAHEAALRDAGMVIVPLDPTQEMQDAGDAACLAGAIVMEDDGHTITHMPGWIYCEMVKAANTDESK